MQISGIKGVLFTRAQAWSLPGGWAYTGDQLGNAPNAGIDNTPDGNLAVSLTGSVINARFGFNRIPSAMAVNNATSIVAPVGTNAFTLPELSGMDPEDMPAASSLIGKSIVIIALSVNGKLFYDNTLLSLNQVIEVYEPGKLKLDPDNAATLITNFISCSIYILLKKGLLCRNRAASNDCLPYETFEKYLIQKVVVVTNPHLCISITIKEIACSTLLLLVCSTQ